MPTENCVSIFILCLTPIYWILYASHIIILYFNRERDVSHLVCFSTFHTQVLLVYYFCKKRDSTQIFCANQEQYISIFIIDVTPILACVSVHHIKCVFQRVVTHGMMMLIFLFFTYYLSIIFCNKGDSYNPDLYFIPFHCLPTKN